MEIQYNCTTNRNTNAVEMDNETLDTYFVFAQL